MWLDNIDEMINIATDGLPGKHKPSYRLFKAAGDLFKATDFYEAINSRNLDVIKFWRRRVTLLAEKNATQNPDDQESSRILEFVKSPLFIKKVTCILKIFSLEEEVDRVRRESRSWYTESNIYAKYELELVVNNEAKNFVRRQFEMSHTDRLAESFLFRNAEYYDKDSEKMPGTLYDLAKENKPHSISRISWEPASKTDSGAPTSDCDNGLTPEDSRR